MVLFGAGCALPLALAALALHDRLGAAFYWIVTFNATAYREQAAADWNLIDALIAGVLLLLLARVRNWKLLALVAGAAVFLIPRPGLPHLAAALPFIAVAAHTNRRPLLKLALVLGLLFTLYQGTLQRHVVSVTTPARDAAYLHSLGARDGDRVWLMTELDANGTFYAWGRFRASPIWTPTRAWFLDVVGSRYYDTLKTDLPLWAVQTRDPNYPPPVEFSVLLNQRYRQVGETETANVWRLIPPDGQLP